ncbi:MAG: hypothetical protein [Microvirus sp.]|nr:MAG: hypothetical protein [Microvirus sp.]
MCQVTATAVHSFMRTAIHPLSLEVPMSSNHMVNRHELSPTAARKLFAGTTGQHPRNMIGQASPAFVSRGGIRF